MEKIPEIRIVGGAPKEEKEAVKGKFENLLSDHYLTLREILLKEGMTELELMELARAEYPKTEQELNIIDFANEEINKLMEEAGIVSYNIPKENFHILPPESYKKIMGKYGSGAAVADMQAIILNAERIRTNLIDFGMTVFHELMHLKGHFSLEVKKEDDEKINKKIFRQGVEVFSAIKSDKQFKKHKHFYGLHEAIVAKQEKNFLQKFINQTFLKKEKEQFLSDEFQKNKKEIIKEKNIAEEDIYYAWISKDNKQKEWGVIGYHQQREVLDYIMEEIKKDNSDQFQNNDEVFKEFLKAHFTGQLLPIARLVEKTFGNNSFRLFGNMANDPDSAILTFESLRKNRLKNIK